jgi:hypothetical protein
MNKTYIEETRLFFYISSSVLLSLCGQYWWKRVVYV